MDALAYTSPSIVTILVLASYLLFLSIFYHAFQRLFSAGILGPLVLGAIYARPLANILPPDVQSAVLDIGYLGLILLIVQGGLEARMDILSNPKNLVISVLVGASGILLPIGLSMALLPLGFGYGYLESFAVGAALASTSLGTTFAVLGSFNGSAESAGAPDDGAHHDHAESGIAGTRIGTILIGAALLDDIVGLVIIGVISTLGESDSGAAHKGLGSLQPWTIARPIVSSFLLLVVSWLLSQFALGPLARLLATRISNLVDRQALAQLRPFPSASGDRTLLWLASKLSSNRLVATTLLIFTVLAYSVISEEIGSSLLIGAFCSGAMMKYLYNVISRKAFGDAATSTHENSRLWSPDHLLSSNTSLGIVQDTILVPFFFSSIGSAIPVKSMFQGTTVWRGVIFAGLMAFAKVCAGGWIFLADLIEQRSIDNASKISQGRKQQSSGENAIAGSSLPHADASIEMRPAAGTDLMSDSHNAAAEAGQGFTQIDLNQRTLDHSQRALVWPASLFLGTALMSRGEIGFLVINIANQGGLLDEQAFNVATWAIVLNTLAGPMAIGMLMRTQYGQDIIRAKTGTHMNRWS